MGTQNKHGKGETQPRKRCVLYARCSTRDQDTENQLAQLRKYAEAQEWVVVEEEKGDRPPMKDYKAEWVGETVWWQHMMKWPPIGRFNSCRAACFLAL